MSRSYIPTTDQGLNAFSANFAAKIAAAPGDYGLTPALAAEYEQKQSNYAQALQLASNPGTRGLTTVMTKRIARDQLVALTRTLSGIVRSTTHVSDAQRLELGLPARSTRRRRIPRPREAPRVSIAGVRGNRVRLRISDPEAHTPRKPDDVAGAEIYGHAGPEPAPGISQWRFLGRTTRTTQWVRFGEDAPPGTQVWLAACWFNPRGQTGPMSRPMSTHIQHGLLQAA